MTETKEQRRERLAIALWELDCRIERRKAKYEGLDVADAWAKPWSPEGCGPSTQKRYRHRADAIIASDEEAGMVVVPVDEIERLRIGSRALRDQFRDGNKYDAAAKEQD